MFWGEIHISCMCVDVTTLYIEETGFFDGKNYDFRIKNIDESGNEELIMKEIKEQVLKTLQTKVKGDVKIERDYSCIGWDITIEYHDFNFVIFMFDEYIHKYPVNDIVQCIIKEYQHEIYNYYFK